ncbi:hypothetical protein CQ13_04080 [Bradyrhizobium retamae]|uniref:Uncharacterized protein n=1 Tax=Bradyrhizobium retamae TaxID=1300035 RepID=A0A0R3N518_9BRAD|nr:hypothetical protein CQ13_04080 [Bradyrhizobium retamae]
MIDHSGSKAGGISNRNAGFGNKRIQSHFSSRACPMLACARFDFRISQPDIGSMSLGGSMSYSLAGCDAKALLLAFY